MPEATVMPPAAVVPEDRLTLGATFIKDASSPSNWWSGMAGVPFADETKA
ncbi:MAG TPA: hypothetical protein VIG24_08200 [Acidimicrobiia bacterium]